MTKQEFTKEIKRIIDTFGPSQFPEQRIIILYDFMKDLEASWLQKTVTQMIATMNIRFDLFESARAERIRTANIKFTDDIVAASETFKQNITSAGLRDTLKSFGAKSLVDAVKKQRKKH